MSRTRSLRTRLDRLTQRNSDAATNSRPEFKIDPAVAKSLRDDYVRANALRGKIIKWGKDSEATPAEEEEFEVLSARIVETTEAIGCPDNYGQDECDRDEQRLSQLRNETLSSPSDYGRPLTEGKAAEEAQLTARIAVFKESRKGPMQYWRFARSRSFRNALKVAIAKCEEEDRERARQRAARAMLRSERE